MSPIAPALDRLTARIGTLSQRLGQRVDVGSLKVTDRQGVLPLAEPGLWSPNRACRLVQTADGWIAINLAREEDRELVPAWLCTDMTGDPWDAIVELARACQTKPLIDQAILLGMPVARVSEVREMKLDPPALPLGRSGPPEAERPLRVVDLSALWAGPLCGAVLAAMGADVVKVESPRRPDPTRVTSPAFYQRLNGQKGELELDLVSPAGRAKLQDEVAAADVLITSARPRGLASLGLEAAQTFKANPRLTWVAITGYGWEGDAAMRVAFGDDAAAAGGLVRWTEAGEPHFLGDALSDPVTGLAAASGALAAVIDGGGRLIDVAMARSAAAAAAVCGLAVAA
ncbi:MAG TPA: CoA transferase [Caulobacteraceae bacterium]|nr:CoA transferase [Caulobacteraceae bacterium]